MSRDRILLIGMMGSGKTSVGEAISAITGWPYRDNDDLLREILGVDTAALLDRDGEDALRDAESAVLHRALHDPGPLVAGIAGGVVERPDDVEVLRECAAFVVYLDTPLDVLVERVGDGSGRPFLQPDPEAALRRLLGDREKHYREVADMVLDTTHGSADDHAAQVVDEARKL